MSLELHTLSPKKGTTKKRKRVGRGPGSGKGVTTGRGDKGQKSRSGYSSRSGFEGGQMPLYRRLPKRGFHNIFSKEYAILNLRDLNVFDEGTTVTPALLKERGMIRKARHGVRILGEGDLEKKLTVQANHFSKTARKKIEQAGGTAEVVS